MNHKEEYKKNVREALIAKGESPGEASKLVDEYHTKIFVSEAMKHKPSSVAADIRKIERNARKYR